MKNVQRELRTQIEMTRSEMDRESINNQTFTSNFSNNTENIEEVRRKLAETSIELEEQKERYKRSVAKQYKDTEFNFQQIESGRQDEKKMRVKINQLENDLLAQIRRLDIICKSKGLPRPKKDILQTAQTASAPRATGGTYISPYNRNRISPAGGANTYGTRSNGA